MTGWIRGHRKVAVGALGGLALLIAMALVSSWFGWGWKVLIGWKPLISYINPQDATDRKDAVQVYAVIVAGVVASITATVGLLNLRLTRRNLEQQRELEAQRAEQQRVLEAQRAEQQRELEAQRAEQQRVLAQGAALQAYYEQIGKLLTEYDLRDTQREEIRELARGQTLTVLQEVDGNGKESLLAFLHGAGLIGTDNPAVALTGANLLGAPLRRAHLQGANLQEADLGGADLQDANLQGADLQSANLRRTMLLSANLKEANFKYAYFVAADLRGADLRGADLRGAATDLRGANFQGADLRGADLAGAKFEGAYLQDAKVSDEQLAGPLSLQSRTFIGIPTSENT
jgi:uncharacterized protein YjbI with pentapeptide repeats